MAILRESYTDFWKSERKIILSVSLFAAAVGPAALYFSENALTLSFFAI